VEIRVVVVEPLYQINLGYIARVSMNFGVSELYLVNPRCKINGNQAVKYSKHARSLLEGAKISKSIEESIRGTFSIGTTGIWRKSRGSFRNLFAPDRVCKLVRKNGIGRVSVVLGRDDTGLESEELRLFDALSFIPADDRYPVLNISHALAIMLYSLRASEYGEAYALERFYASGKEITALQDSIGRFLQKNKTVRDKRAVLSAMRHLLKRANPSKKEINALHAAFSEREK
jgi:tRNA/rRNA methyltransferase